MLRNVFLKTLHDQRRAFLWWGIGLIALALYIILFYPSMRDSMSEITRVMEQMPPALKAMFGTFDFTSLVGYLQGYIFSYLAPLLFLIVTIGFGVNAIAGEERKGTLDLLLSNPLPRRQVVVEKFAALVVYLIALAFFLWLGLAIGVRVIAMDMNIGLGRLAEATASVVLLGLAFGALALALGCASGNRGLSIGIASAVAVATYFLNTLGPMVEGLTPYRKLSPFYYYIGAEPLRNGLDLGHAAVLIGMIVVLLAVALIAFERRDLAV
jgi:ABC-2 type transport system permease protein